MNYVVWRRDAPPHNEQQYLRHFSKTLDFACAERRQNQGFWKNGEHVGIGKSVFSVEIQLLHF